MVGSDGGEVFLRALALGQLDLFGSVGSDPCQEDLVAQARLVGPDLLGPLVRGRIRAGVCKCGGRCRGCPSRGKGV